MPRNKGIGGHQSAKMLKDEWITSRDIIDQLKPFDLDPASSVNHPWPIATINYTPADNGLLKEWPRDAFIWLNPPYSKYLDAWMNRMAMHNNGIALIFARTETRTFFKYIWPVVDSILFIKGRLTFYNVDGTTPLYSSGAPSILIAYGKEATRRLENCNIKGKLIYLR
ncbi:MAG: DNA N-6-adenine-methyltransferase [Atribacterota bacterium]|nr:DNA N-6-adenine-methyltransferase [Atribacterota bacterium]